MTDEEDSLEQSSGGHVLFTTVVVLLGSPIFILGIAGHHWAWIALKVYLWTAIVFGTLFSLERTQLHKGWFWYALAPLILFHVVVMSILVYVNLASPVLDDYPVATYGVIMALLVPEGNWFHKILQRKRASRDLLR